MKEKTRKFFLLAFVMITVVLVAGMLYSTSEYIGMFRAARSITVSIQDFEFGILDLTSAVATTTVKVDNPSRFEFLTLGIQQRVEMNGIYYVGTSYKEGITVGNPYRIAPGSTSNISLSLSLNLIALGSSNPELVELLFDPSADKDWQIIAFVFLEGPILGRFTMTAARSISAS